MSDLTVTCTGGWTVGLDQSTLRLHLELEGPLDMDQQALGQLLWALQWAHGQMYPRRPAPDLLGQLMEEQQAQPGDPW